MRMFESADDFRERLAFIGKFLTNRSAFPMSIFRTMPCAYAFVDFGEITSRKLFSLVVSLCGELYEPTFSFMMTRPDPINYFFRHFGWLPGATFSHNDTFEMFSDLMIRDPGHSLADAIAYRIDEVIISSENAAAIVYGDRNFDLAVIAAFKAVDLSRLDNCRILIDPSMAYDRLIYDRLITIKKDAFLKAWQELANDK